MKGFVLVLFNANSSIHLFNQHLASKPPKSAAEDQSREANLASVALRGLEAAVAQAAVGRGPTAGDDLQLLLGSVRPVQQLLDELLQSHFGVGLARRRLLEELIDLGDLPANKQQRNNRKSFQC